MAKKKRIPTTGGVELSHNPFGALSGEGLPEGKAAPELPKPKPPKKKVRQRVDIIRQTAHRGGKTVTVIQGLDNRQKSDIERLAKRLQKECGTGGTVKGKHIELQGDKRSEAARILDDEGFKPVFAGG
jgi:translation initiation factor 1